MGLFSILNVADLLLSLSLMGILYRKFDFVNWKLHKSKYTLQKILQQTLYKVIKGIVQQFKRGVVGGIIRLAFKFSSFPQFF
jgi:hypothetical protein